MDTENQQNPQKRSFLDDDDDTLFCHEQEKWGDDIEIEEETNLTNVSLFPLLLFQQQDLLLWGDDDELQSLLFKEKETCVITLTEFIKNDHFLCLARKEAVQWILKIVAFYGFSPSTAIVAVNYLDRFLCCSSFQKDKAWMMQLVAVTCLSLAAKVEETRVPLLLDLQVEGAQYVFEAKTIQKMELLVLSSLKWRMNPVTPLSFIDHIIRRFGLKSVHWEFLSSCENLILSVISDSRFMHYLPSVICTAIMLHVIHQVDPCNAIDYENQLVTVLKISKENLDDCYELILDVLSNSSTSLYGNTSPSKRKNYQSASSSSGVMDAIYNSDGSNDSWGVESCISSASPSPQQPFYKKSRVHEQTMKLPSLSRVFVDAVGSPH